MTKIDIISGFLGAGKTTLIKKLIEECFRGQKIVLVENEFGEIGVDGGFLKDAGIEISEINSGCICCSLVGDFKKALRQVAETYHPDRIVIEPSGVGKLSDVIRAVEGVELEDVVLNSFTAVVDGTKCRMYMKNFGEFFNDQIENAHTIIISRTQKMTDAKLAEAVELLKQHNPKAVLITTPWDQLDGSVILSAMEHDGDMMKELMAEAVREHHHHHDEDDHDHDEHHHHHDDEECDDPDCCCHDGEHHHHHDEDDHDHDEHHHHHDDEECDDPDCCCHDGEHHHHHDEDEHDHDEHHHHHDDEECDDPDCCCHDGEHHHHHHHHHGGHDADEVFVNWGVETPHKFSEEALERILKTLAESDAYGSVLRAKGIVPSVEEGVWLHFDLTPEEYQIRHGSADYTGRICVIGTGLAEDKLPSLFGLV